MTTHGRTSGPGRPLLATLLVATLLLASCAPAAAPAQPQAPAGQPPAAQPPPAATATPAGPKRGGSIVWALYNEAGEYDPHTLAQQMYLWELGGNSLLKLDRDTGKPVGDLVERWEQKDNLTFVFYLRKGVKFHNTAPVNGREFKADDVVYSMARLRSPGAKFPRRSYFDSVKSIEKVDDYAVKFTLSQPFGPLLVYMAFPFIKMVPKEVVDKYNGLERPEATIGTGPFLFKEYTKDVGGTMVRNPNFFRPGLPYLDEVRLQVITDEATRISAVRTSRVDIAQRIPASGYKSIQQTSPNVLADTEAVPWTAQVIMRTDLKPWSDIRVRRAINLAVDRQEIVSGAHEGAGFITGAIPVGQVPWAGLDFEKDLKNLPGYRQPKDQDIAEARKLLADAGFPNGLDTTISMTDYSAILNRRPAEVLVTQLAKVGIRAKPKVLEQAAYLNSERSGDFDLIVRGLGAVVEPDEYIWLSLHSTGSRNYGKYKDPEIDKMLEAARSTYDIAERGKLYKEAQLRAIDQAARVYLDEPYTYTTRQSFVKNYNGSWFYPQHQFSDVWLNK